MKANVDTAKSADNALTISLQLSRVLERNGAGVAVGLPDTYHLHREVALTLQSRRPIQKASFVCITTS